MIKRIADYKLAVVGSAPIGVNYSAEGIPNTLELKGMVSKVRAAIAQGYILDENENRIPVEMDKMFPDLNNQVLLTNEEISIVMSAMSDYFRVTAERVKFDDLREQALRNAYVSGTGVLYTYWNDRIRTGLYADEGRKHAVTGDICCEVLDIENVYFGDPNLDDIQSQPFIIIEKRESVRDLKREARINHVPADEYNQIRPDRDTNYMAGEMSEEEPASSKKATALIKLWKVWNDDGTCSIKGIKVCGKSRVRPEWDLGIRLYPLAKFSWERRRNSAYGESEITYLIPNQIAINRMITASVWAVIMMGMPIMVVNGSSGTINEFCGKHKGFARFQKRYRRLERTRRDTGDAQPR